MHPDLDALLRADEEARQALASAEFSAVIESLDDTPIIVERAMYRDSGGRVFDAGHESTGITTPATDWFLAEGATGPFFDMFVLIANPTATDADVTVTYLTIDGTTYRRTFVARANSRSGIWVDQEQFPGVAGLPLAERLRVRIGRPARRSIRGSTKNIAPMFAGSSCTQRMSRRFG